MSKKQLLSEGEIRRFMKFAKLEPLAESFISEAGYGMEEEGGLYEEEDADMGDMGDEAGLEVGDEEVAAPAGDAEAVVADALADLAAKLKAELGVDISIDAGAPAGEEVEMDMDVEEPAVDMEDEEGEEEEEQDEAMLQEVTRRVIARISESRRRADRANAIDEVTNRIMKRILKSK